MYKKGARPDAPSLSFLQLAWSTQGWLRQSGTLMRIAQAA